MRVTVRREREERERERRERERRERERLRTLWNLERRLPRFLSHSLSFQDSSLLGNVIQWFSLKTNNVPHLFQKNESNIFISTQPKNFKWVQTLISFRSISFFVPCYRTGSDCHGNGL